MRRNRENLPAFILAGGMSLVELLIAMTLGLILLGGMLAVFSSNKQSSELNTAMANMQENARFALGKLSEDIRMAGYQGCLDPEQGMLIVKATDKPIPILEITDEGETLYNAAATAATGSVVVSADDWQPAIFGDFIPPVNKKAIAGSHALSIQRGNSEQTTLSDTVMLAGIPSVNGPIVTSDNLDLKAGDLAIISDCDKADLFTVSSATLTGTGQTLQHTSPLNSDGSLSDYYGLSHTLDQTFVMRFESNIYFIADTGLENESGDKVRALYQQTYPYDEIANPPVEIVQGVENMRLSYGINIQNTLRYVTADDLWFDPSEVESIQIGLIMTSWDRISEHDDENTYVIAGQSIPPSDNSVDALTHAKDGRYRLVFNTTVKIRNRRGNDVETNL